MLNRSTSARKIKTMKPGWLWRMVVCPLEICHVWLILKVILECKDQTSGMWCKFLSDREVWINHDKPFGNLTRQLEMVQLQLGHHFRTKNWATWAHCKVKSPKSHKLRLRWWMHHVRNVSHRNLVKLENGWRLHIPLISPISIHKSA